MDTIISANNDARTDAARSGAGSLSKHAFSGGCMKDSWTGAPRPTRGNQRVIEIGR